MAHAAPDLQRYALDLELSGRYYAGTAIQPPHIPTLHRHLADALNRLQPGSGSSLQCCSRLDAGVAAEHFTVHCDLSPTWEPHKLAQALNGLLKTPQHERHAVIWRAAHVDNSWDAWRSAQFKTYCYRILASPFPPLSSHRVLWIKHQLDVSCLMDCAQNLLGNHDLSGFAALRHDPSDAYHPLRSIISSEWRHLQAERGTWLVYTVTGNGFLYKQVRGMVGAMIACGQHPERGIDAFRQVITEGRQAPRLGEIVGPEGLWLADIDYGPQTPQWLSHFAASS